VNGWDPDAQRAFIALLAATGSKRQAAKALNRNDHGITQSLKRDDSASFRLAYDRALAIAKANGSMKIAQGVADAATRNAQLTPPSRLIGLPAPAEPAPEMDEDARWALVERIGAKFMRKVAAEREARLAGEIVAADFYLRQVTFMEVLFDLSASGLGLDPHEVLRGLRRGQHSILDIAATSLSDWLDASRRKWWAEEGEPERPPHPDTRFLKRYPSDDGPYAIQQDLHSGAWTDAPPGVDEAEWKAMDRQQQEDRLFEFQAQLEEEQMEWEARAHQEYRERRAALLSDDRPLLELDP
jgi:hypothetical protein